jgi:hypothetical protein
MRRLTTARQVVDVLGGLAAVCKLTGAAPKSTYHWTGRNGMFPARTHWIMQRELKRRGCSAPPHLWNQIGADKEAA